MALQAVELDRPDPATFDAAVADYAKASAAGDAQAMMKAMLVMIGDACAQLDIDKKSREEVIASLSARGVHPDAAPTLVDKASEIINSDVNKARAAGVNAPTISLTVGHFAVIIVVAAIIAYLIFRS